MQTADNLVPCHHYVSARAAPWTGAGKDPRGVRVQVAKLFSRRAVAVVAGPHLFAQPCCQPRPALLGKLLALHGEHGTDPVAVRQDLDAAVAPRPPTSRAAAAAPLQKERDAVARRRGPQPLAEIIPLVRARLAGRVVPSTPRARGLLAGRRGCGVPQRLVEPVGPPGLSQPWRAGGSPRLLRPVGVRRSWTPWAKQ